MVATMPSTFGTQRRINVVGGCRVGIPERHSISEGQLRSLLHEAIGCCLMNMPRVHDTIVSLKPGFPQTAPGIVSATEFRRKGTEGPSSRHKPMPGECS